MKVFYLAVMLTSLSAFAAEERILLPNAHLKVVKYDLVDQTDKHNELVHRTEWLLGHNESETNLTASILAVENILTGEGTGDDVVIIGCNALNHLAAGLFEVQRTGNDTSGKDWSWTRNHGVNTLAMRGIQDRAFFAVDADCVGLAEKGAVPWELNRQWMDLLGRSGTPFFVSWRRQLVGPEVRKALAEAFRRASSDRPTIEPLDWQEVRTPNQWRDVDGLVNYEWK